MKAVIKAAGGRGAARAAAAFACRPEASVALPTPMQRPACRPASSSIAEGPSENALARRAASSSATSSGSVSINTRPSFTWIQRMSVRCQSRGTSVAASISVPAKHRKIEIHSRRRRFSFR